MRGPRLQVRYTSLAFGVLVVGACEVGLEPQWRPLSSGAAAGGYGGGGGTSPGGTSSIKLDGSSGLMFPDVLEPCVARASAEQLLFGEQAVRSVRPASKRLYSWTTAEQVAELRANQVLLTRTERPGLGRGYAFDVLDQLAASQQADAALAQLLTAQFAKARYAWSNAWSTRLGYPGEDYGDQLIEIVLRDQAWIVSLIGGQLSAVDLQNTAVPLEDVLAHPERVGAIFFVKDAEADAPRCGSFGGGGTRYREFLVGNESMIERWSIGTLDLKSQIAADVERLKAFLSLVRAKPLASGPESWIAWVGCSDLSVCPTTVEEAYMLAVSAPSVLNHPSPQKLATLIETLEGDELAAALVVSPQGP